MADKFISIEINEDDVIRNLDRGIDRVRRHSRNLLDDIAGAGVIILHASVPQSTTYTLRHVDREPVRWFPGGPGGGGEYGTTVGIKRGTSIHPIYPEEGTGIFATPARGFITPRTKPYLSFFSTLYNRRIRVRQVKGQRAQRYFYSAWRDLDVYAAGRILRGSLTT